MEKFKNSLFYKILAFLKNCLCWLLIICLALIMLMSVITKINGSVPNLFGYSILRISSGSMEPELSVGDVILDKRITDNSQIKNGDVITFYGSGELSGMLVTHKVIKEPYLDENNDLMLQTQGTANDTPDDPITADSVMSEMVCKIPFLNFLYDLFLSPWGLLLFIGLILITFVDEVINIVKILTGNSKTAKDADDINDIISRIQSEKTEER